MGIDDVFAVIAERTRRDILESLRAEGKSVGELVGELQVSQPTVSKHLKVLREAGLVSMRAQGQKRFYSLETAPLHTVQDWLDSFSPERLAEAAPQQAGVPGGGAPDAGPEGGAAAGEPPAAQGAPAVEPAPDAVLSAVAAAAAGAGTPSTGAPSTQVPSTGAPDTGAPAAGALAAAALTAPGGPPPAAADTTRQQQIGRTMGRAAERAADLISQLRRRRDHER
jgi:DNA-binding transcriptional ArsR family regulator